MLVKGALDGMELPVSGHRFDGGDVAAVRLNGQHGAGLHRTTVHQHGAGSTRRGVTTDVRSSQAERLTQEIHEQLARFDVRLLANAVDGDRDMSQGEPTSFYPRTRAVRAAV